MRSHGRLLNRQQCGGWTRSKETQEMGLQEEEKSAAQAAQISSAMKDSKRPQGNCSKATSWGLRWFASLLWGDIFPEKFEMSMVSSWKCCYPPVAACKGEFGARGLLQSSFSPVSSLPVQGPASFVDPLRFQMISTVTRGIKNRASWECLLNLRYLGCKVSGSALSPVVANQSYITLSESGIWRVTKDAYYTDAMF